MQPTSSFFKAIAGILELIENLGIPSDQYGVVDNGEALELSKNVYGRIKDTPEYLDYEANGGGSYCYDDNEWEAQR